MKTQAQIKAAIRGCREIVALQPDGKIDGARHDAAIAGMAMEWALEVKPRGERAKALCDMLDRLSALQSEGN